jgi:hypothetical protein
MSYTDEVPQGADASAPVTGSTSNESAFSLGSLANGLLDFAGKAVPAYFQANTAAANAKATASNPAGTSLFSVGGVAITAGSLVLVGLVVLGVWLVLRK